MGGQERTDVENRETVKDGDAGWMLRMDRNGKNIEDWSYTKRFLRLTRRNGFIDGTKERMLRTDSNERC